MPVEFNDEYNLNKTSYTQQTIGSQTPKLVGILLKTGIVKNENQANYILMLIVIIALSTSFFLFFKSSTENRPIMGSFESMNGSSKMISQ